MYEYELLLFVIFDWKFREELLLPGVVVVVIISLATAIVFVVAAASTTIVVVGVASAAIAVVATAAVEKYRGCLGQQLCSLNGKALEAIVVFSVFLSFLPTIQHRMVAINCKLIV